MEQTYTNLQIILVDDGSVDNSLNICKKWMEMDSRIEIYHKINGGLSSARNYGLRHAKGDYICFVDADDWVDKEYVYILQKGIADNKCEMSGVSFDYVYSDKTKPYEYPVEDCVMDKEKAAFYLCEGKKITSHLWNKMYKKDLFDGLCFEEGRNYEDIFIMHKLMDRISHISFCNKVLYHYVMREDSIIHKSTSKNDVDVFMAYLDRFEFYSDKLLKRLLMKFCSWASFKVLFFHKKNEFNEKDYEKAKKFWEMHNDIPGLGIKYWVMYHFPVVFSKLYLCLEDIRQK